MTPTTAGSLDPRFMLARARMVIAREVLDAESCPATVGQIALHAHQRRAAARILTLLRAYGGALLADATGLGKTFVALAIADTLERILIIAPASLRDGWRRSAALAGIQASFVSLERLSRGIASPMRDPELVIVDEAHHLRNPRTKRYSAVAALCDRARVLLLSATPLQNRRNDLVAQLALFLGDDALSATDAELARYIVRRRTSDTTIHIPAVHGPEWIRLPNDDDLLDELVALPPPLPAEDEGEAGALVSYTLLRQWASSRAALVAALRRRLAKAFALISSLETGRWPTRDAIAAWSQADTSVQLALPELLSPLGSRLPIEAMLVAVRAHADGIRAMLATLRGRPDPDPIRAAALADICCRHGDARVLAFSQYADTVRALSRLLIGGGHAVAELTARGGRVAGGRLQRGTVLAQFTPGLSDAEPRAADRIALLVTTDVLSEGLDLQRASVVVHVDLPWNPARLEQRVGRVRRLGSPHDIVHVYAFAPPASSERVLRVESRLRTKLRLAGRIVGLDATSIPDVGIGAADPAPEATSAMLALLERWRDASVADHVTAADEQSAVLCASVDAPNDGFLALLADGDERILLGKIEQGNAGTDPVMVDRVVHLCAGEAVAPLPTAIQATLDDIAEWCQRRAARSRLAMSSPVGACLRRRISARITSVLATAPRYERATLAPIASRARDALGASLGAGAERALENLARSDGDHAVWLSAVAALGAGRRLRQPPGAASVPLVVILLRRTGDGPESGSAPRASRRAPV